MVLYLCIKILCKLESCFKLVENLHEYCIEMTKTTPVNKVFLVDDDKIFNIFQKKVVEKAGLSNEVFAFENASNVIHQLRDMLLQNPEQIPDVIFLDLNMPIMDGWEFLEEFEKISFPSPDRCRVYILSSSIDPFEIARSKNYKTVKEFISKPLTIDKLKELFFQ